jgi:hypothetical protein
VDISPRVWQVTILAMFSNLVFVWPETGSSLRALDKMVLRGLFAHKRNDTTRYYRKFLNELFHNI